MDKTYIGVLTASFAPGLESQPVTGVTLLDDDGSILAQAGDSRGKVLELTNPDGTAAMAAAILRKTGGVSYRPYSAEDAMLDPAAELGDGVTVGGLYSVLAGENIRLDGAGLAAISAPETNEIEDEYPYVSPRNRDIQRKFQRTRSLISKTAEEIRLEVANEVEGLSASIDIKLGSITSTVQGIGGQVSTLQQTARSLQSQINSANGSISTISQKVDNIRLSVSNGADSSWISLMVDGVEVSSKRIKFTGDVVFASDLSDGTTTVSGDCITTGEISAAYIKLGGEMAVYRSLSSNQLGGYLGYVTGHNAYGGATTGLGLLDPNEDYQVVVTNGGARLTSPSAEVVAAYNITLDTENNIVASTDITVTSDRRKKEEIRYDVDTRYAALFDALKPASFLYKGKGPARHLGFIAQDVAEAAEALGLGEADLALLSVNEKGYYGLNYSEFIPILTAKIMELESKIKELGEWKI